MPATPINDADLLKVVKQMGPVELDAFLEQALRLRVPSKTARLSATESKLIERINRGIPEEFLRRHAQLARKRKTSRLTDLERAELLKLTNAIETCDAERAADLVSLAKLRRVPVRLLMNDLGIQAAPVHG
ncbi:MAG TPA: hypothetical protein VHR66_21790 [Gemmataceae bacterium]|jgi:hypothetical protein|nr:hypothetical protein [Gemmataceae bacterium]